VLGSDTPESKREQGSELDAPIVRSVAKKVNRGGLTEQRRRKITHESALVQMIENVVDVEIEIKPVVVVLPRGNRAGSADRFFRRSDFRF